MREACPNSGRDLLHRLLVKIKIAEIFSDQVLLQQPLRDHVGIWCIVLVDAGYQYLFFRSQQREPTLTATSRTTRCGSRTSPRQRGRRAFRSRATQARALPENQ